MAPKRKKRRTDQEQPRNGGHLQFRRNISSPDARTDKATTPRQSSASPTVHVGGIYLKIQQAKKNAVAQAQQDGCTGNFRSFDSPFGNFLVPVIPTLADLTGIKLMAWRMQRELCKSDYRNGTRDLVRCFGYSLFM
ncbi:uncharacterized protein LOC122072208 isoform X2 [Macadamia integrifolia]|uniref:uncharacterized protein LOC122072208 isoform X2 n=1 Tax=Macadamia integrifolia TaxID=60698 RepID=UPI001C500733|nr:uncharacterized protein LOC122072208 isoform X2 [Macadamia integrifolia]